MISNFWKKFTIFNAALLIILLRIYGPLFNFVNEKAKNNSIFAKSDKSGYPFKESLEYNLDKIKQITILLIEKYKNTPIIMPMPQKTMNKCSFLKKIKICGDEKECFEEINNIKEGKFSYHKMDEYNNSKIINNDMIINLIQEKNQFLHTRKNILEIPLYHKIIDGYEAYLLISSNNINLIKQVTTNENKMNNLLFLYILYFKSYISTDKIKDNMNINKLLEYHYTYLNRYTSSLSNFEIDQLLFIINNNIRDNIIYCIPDLDTRYSFLIDFHSIYTMLETIYFYKENKSDNKKIDFLFYKLANSINNIFSLDKIINEKSKIYVYIQKYLIYIYWIFSIIIIYFCNKYFIKHKEFYKSKTRTVKNINANSEFKKYLKYQDNIRKIQKRNRSKYTKEEIEMINKLTKDQKDYIISK